MTASLDDDKAQDVVVIDLQGKSGIADYMVIATGSSGRQLAAMTDHLITEMKAANITGIVAEGGGTSDWVLLDGGDVIVHVFRQEVRDFYDLEKMWGGPKATGETKTTQIGSVT